MSEQLTIEKLQHAVNVVQAQGHQEIENIVSPAEVGISVPPEGILNAAPVEIPAAEEAAQKFTMLLPFVKKLGNALQSQKGVVRVLHALAEFPLGAEKPRLLNDSERQLFQVCMEVQGVKSTVINDIMKKNAEAHQEAEALKQAAIAQLNNGSAEPGVSNE